VEPIIGTDFRLVLVGAGRARLSMAAHYWAIALANSSTGRKVQILERDETMGDVLKRRTAKGKTLRVKFGRCNVCYFRFGMLSLDSPFSPQP
jgi:hypothetical protein